MSSAKYSRIQAFFMAQIVYTQGVFHRASYPCPKLKKDGSKVISSFKNKDGRIMAMAHRADWKNYPENSIPAMQSCIDMGVDIIETDVQRTSDGVIVISHDGKLDRMTNGKGRISEMTYKEIQKYNLKQGRGGKGTGTTSYKIPTFIEVLELCCGKIMVNIDKGMSYKDEIRDLLEKYDSLDNCYFVDSTPYEEIETWFAQLKSAGKKLPMFGCKMKKEDTKVAEDYLKSHISGGYSPIVEMSFKDDTWAAGKQEIVSLARTGMRINGNPITSSKCGGHKDDETGWAYLINLGYNVMQTDHIHEMVGYLNAINNVRSASSRIEAEHFSDASGVKVTLADKSLNKILYSLHAGCSVEYKNIDFGIGMKKIIINGRAHTGGKIEVYIDGFLAGTVNVPRSISCRTVTAEIDEVSGIHNISFKITGKKITNISIDWFSFS
ncbi:MAG: glycerophosphodiester phosphodiesterase family protein [Eubacteriales bacterium]